MKKTLMLIGLSLFFFGTPVFAQQQNNELKQNAELKLKHKIELKNTDRVNQAGNKDLKGVDSKKVIDAEKRSLNVKETKVKTISENNNKAQSKKEIDTQQAMQLEKRRQFNSVEGEKVSSESDVRVRKEIRLKQENKDLKGISNESTLRKINN